jgi:hypothetical protein
MVMLSFGMDALRQAGITVPPLPRFHHAAYSDKAKLAAARKEHQQQLRERLKQILALSRQYGKGFAAYDIRDGFCQRMLESGLNHLAVAEIMGHSNGQMVASVYSHMNRANEHLKEALKKASGDAGLSWAAAAQCRSEVGRRGALILDKIRRSTVDVARIRATINLPDKGSACLLAYWQL